MEQSPSWEAKVAQLVKKFPAFYGTRMFITVFTIPPVVPILTQMNPIHNFPAYVPYIHFNIIISSTPRHSERSLPFRLPD
jgi:hypothetical protein